MFSKPTVKYIVSLIVGSTVSTVTVLCVKNNLPVAESRNHKVRNSVGAFMIGTLAAHRAKQYTDNLIDEWYPSEKEETPEETPETPAV
jgi:tetrahydromethanopterin S-methyltransferase subunit C